MKRATIHTTTLLTPSEIAALRQDKKDALARFRELSKATLPAPPVSPSTGTGAGVTDPPPSLSVVLAGFP